MIVGTLTFMVFNYIIQIDWIENYFNGKMWASEKSKGRMYRVYASRSL